MTRGFPARCAAWFAAFLLMAGVVFAASVPPGPSPRYVHDDAGWLGAHVFTELDLKLERFERETSSQVVVGIFPKLPEGEELFDYSQRIFDAWMPGRKGKNNGVLLLVFAEDRKIRIHVGYGLEGALPDALAGRIIRDEMAPRLRAGDREGAVEAGVNAILAAAKGEYRGDGRTRLDDEGAIRIHGGWLVLAVILFLLLGWRFPVVFQIADVIFSGTGPVRTSGGGWSSSGGGGWRGGSSGGGFSGGGGRSGGGGASGGW